MSLTIFYVSSRFCDVELDLKSKNTHC